MMLSLKIKIEDIHHCKETHQVHATVRTGLGQPTWSIPATPVPAGTILVTPGLGLVRQATSKCSAAWGTLVMCKCHVTGIGKISFQN